MQANQADNAILQELHLGGTEILLCKILKFAQLDLSWTMNAVQLCLGPADNESYQIRLTLQIAE